MMRRSFSTSCGIIGYPNIGKSTLFNALVKTQMAKASNYPFCTIEPNMAKVGVMDDNVRALAEVTKAPKITPDQIEVWDIAGLIKGASQGAGLGNKFLANIRSVECIIHLVRCFKNEDIIHVTDQVNLDPLTELDDVQTELILADLEICLKKMRKKGLTVQEVSIWQKVSKILDRGEMIRHHDFSNRDEANILKTLPLITSKPTVYVCNIEPDAI